MAEALTIEQMINGSIDVDTIEQAALEDMIVTARNGREFPSAPRAVRLILEQGTIDATLFKTRVDLDSGNALGSETPVSLVDDDFALVFKDDDVDLNGYYQKQAGVWEYLPYNIQRQAINQIEQAKQAAIEVAATDAQNKANAAQEEAAIDASQKILKSQVAYNFVETEELLSTRQKVTDSYINSAGVVTTSASRALTEYIPVTPDFFIEYDAYIAVGMSSIAAYDASGVFIKSLLSGTTNKQESGIITFSSDIASIRISIAIAQPNSFLLSKVLGLNDALKKYQLIGDVDLLLENPPVSGSYVDTSGADVVKSTWSRTGLIEVSSGLVVTYNTFSSRSTSTIAAYDSNAVFMYPLLSVAGDVVGNLTIPPNVKYISISIANSKVNKFTITKAVAKSGDGSGGSAVSRYFGAKWLSMGTSIVDSTATPYTYQKWVSEKMGLALFNHASSGSRTRSSLYRKNTNLDEHITASDFITIDHGTNDFKIETPLGSISDTPTPYATMKSAAYNENSDTTGTFYADLKSVIEYIYSIKPSARIMLVTPIKRTQPSATGTETNSLGFKLVDYSTAIKAIAELYSLPCLDNYNTSGFNLNTMPVWTADGLHPTEWAQKNVLTNKMIGFIESN